MSEYIITTERLGLRRWMDTDIPPFISSPVFQHSFTPCIEIGWRYKQTWDMVIHASGCSLS